MGASSVDDVGSGVSGCVSRCGVTGGWGGGVSWMTGLGGDHDGVAAGTFCGDRAGKAVCGVGSSTASERQRTRGLRTGALRNSATLGSQMCLAHLQWRPTLTHLPQESVSLEHQSMWMDLHTEDHETHQADRDQIMSAHLCHEGNRRDHATEVVQAALTTALR